jgi:hypothetical protein
MNVYKLCNCCCISDRFMYFLSFLLLTCQLPTCLLFPKCCYRNSAGLPSSFELSSSCLDIWLHKNLNWITSVWTETSWTISANSYLPGISLACSECLVYFASQRFPCLRRMTSTWSVCLELFLPRKTAESASPVLPEWTSYKLPNWCARNCQDGFCFEHELT